MHQWMSAACKVPGKECTKNHQLHLLSGHFKLFNFSKFQVPFCKRGKISFSNDLRSVPGGMKRIIYQKQVANITLSGETLDTCLTEVRNVTKMPIDTLFMLS